MSISCLDGGKGDANHDVTFRSSTPIQRIITTERVSLSISIVFLKMQRPKARNCTLGVKVKLRTSKMVGGIFYLFT